MLRTDLSEMQEMKQIQFIKKKLAHVERSGVSKQDIVNLYPQIVPGYTPQIFPGLVAPNETCFTLEVAITSEFGENVQLLNIYIKEAHAFEGWFMGDVEGVTVHTPKSLRERIGLAKCFIKSQGYSVKDLISKQAEFSFVVDGLDDALEKIYEAAPERLYVIDRSKHIVWRSGIGPFFYDVDKLRDFLLKKLGNINTSLAIAPQTSALDNDDDGIESQEEEQEEEVDDNEALQLPSLL